MLQRAKVSKIFCTNISNISGNQLKAIPILISFQQVKHPKMLNACVGCKSAIYGAM